MALSKYSVRFFRHTVARLSPIACIWAGLLSGQWTLVFAMQFSNAHGTKNTPLIIKTGHLIKMLFTLKYLAIIFLKRVQILSKKTNPRKLKKAQKDRKGF